MRRSHMADFFLLGSDVKLELELEQQSTCKVWEAKVEEFEPLHVQKMVELSFKGKPCFFELDF